MTTHDVVVRGGTVYDGTGAPPQSIDVAIDDGSISALGAGLGPGRHEYDATGCIVTPGWVDVHTHYDGQVTWDPTLAPSCWHGVTTVVMGNCGVGFAPIRPGREQFLIELMEGVEDIPGTALAEGIQWKWEHFTEYLDALDELDLSVDVGTQVPHGPLRAYVLGDRCNTDYQPTSSEVADMALLVRDGVEAGALGFSTSRTLLHRDVQGVEMPGTFAGAEELIEIGRAMKDLEHGVFQLVSDHLGEAWEWEWIEQVARESGRPVTVVSTSAEGYRDDLIFRRAESAIQRGLSIRPQVAARPTCVLHGLQSRVNIFAKLPSFEGLVAGRSLDQQVARLRTEPVRTILLEELAQAGPHVNAIVEATLRQVFPLGGRPDYEPRREDSVAGMAAAQGRPSVEVMYELLLRDEGRELFYQPLGLYDTFDLAFFERAIENPTSVLGLSDGGAHCGVIADAGMPTFVLTHWGRDRRRGRKFPVEWLVRKLTSDTADAYGLGDRGRLGVGKLGDVNIIDFEALQLERPEARTDLPAGGRRLVQAVEGYRYVLKRGEPIVIDGEVTDARPGRLIRGVAA